MNPEQWQEIERLYHSALERKPEDRSGFLREACGDDETLQRHVESLLAHEADANEFIERPALEVMAEAELLDRPDEESREFQLPLGARLGNYEILQGIGAGGMGQVYRARDVRLHRTVALKTLAWPGIDRGEMRRRFEREAQTISSLNHPNICTVYDIGEQDGRIFLVMEYLEGLTLKQRLNGRPLPVGVLVDVAIQIAGGLAAAHEKGIVHRDIKPANVLLIQHGEALQAKIVDFGLAKLVRTQADLDRSFAQTKDGHITNPGVAVGTAAYMSPEQIRGEDLDARTDLFSFGAVLYEMATGRKPFPGSTAAETMGAILHEAPASPRQLSPELPPYLQEIIEKALDKDRELRYQSAADIRADLKRLRRDSSSSSEPVRRAAESRPVRFTVAKGRRPDLLYGALAVVFLLAVITGFVSYSRLAGRPARAIIAEILPPKDARFQFLGEKTGMAALSPDGHALAFSAVSQDGKAMIWLRSLDSPVARPLPGTEGGSSPFWSPDSRALGFFADGKLKTIDTFGESVIVVSAAPYETGGTWSRDGIILFGADFNIYQVPATGGTPVLVLAPDPPRSTFCGHPSFLPDGRHFLFLGYFGADPASAGTYFASLDGKERHFVASSDTTGIYVSGFLLYAAREGALLAQSFDAARGQLKGAAFPVVEHIGSLGHRRPFDASQNGLLIYLAGAAAKRLTWFDRTGKELGVLGEGEDYFDLRLAPDGRRLAFNAGYPAGAANSEIWTAELDRGVRTRLTFDPDTDHGIPVWSPDGSRLLFGVLQGKARGGIYQKASSGAGDEELILASEDPKITVWPTSWSADGRFILYTRGVITLEHADIWVLPLTGERKPRLLIKTPASAYDGQFSPDGRWVAYGSGESGRSEVYVVRFDAARGSKWQVSSNGGLCPRWRKDGKEIFYFSPPSQIMAVPVETKGGGIVAGTPRVLFQSPVFRQAFANYDVSADGKRFIVNTIGVLNPTLTLLANWTARLKTQ